MNDLDWVIAGLSGAILLLVGGIYLAFVVHEFNERRTRACDPDLNRYEQNLKWRARC